MTREGFRDYVEFLHSQNEISYDVYSGLIDGIDTLEQEPCGDAISRKSIKQKLQEHHDFFVNAYGGFSNMPPNDKSRVDEITQCIAMVVNEPSVNLKNVPDTNVGNIDCISREDAIRIASGYCHFSNIPKELKKLPSVNPQLKTGHCKDCKYFEYDSVAKVNGIPLIVAHEICSRWGDGCKTSEYGYCFLFEPKAESENKAK